MKIGFLDSGIGGLSVLHRALMAASGVDYIYYADSDNAPYGEKSRERVCELVERGVEFLLDRGSEAVVLACNTATSVAAASLRRKYELPIVGIEPAVKPAVGLSGGKPILVTGTPITIKGEKLSSLIDGLGGRSICYMLPLPELVRRAEQGNFDSEEASAYIKGELDPAFSDFFGVVVLGCTHFNYFRDAFRLAFPEPIHIIDGNEGTVRQMLRRVGDIPDGRGSVEYYISGRPADKAEIALFRGLLCRLDEMYRVK